MPGKSLRLIAAAAVLVGIAGCSGKNNVDTSVNDTVNGIPADSHAVTFYRAGHRAMVGDVVGTTVQGTTLNLASFRGKWIVVNYWYANCGPCEAEEQGFEATSKALAPQGVQFVGIDERDNVAAARNFERVNHVTYPTLFDRTDQYTLDFRPAVPTSTPFTIVIDPKGGIAAKSSAPLDLTSLRSFLAKARSEPA